MMLLVRGRLDAFGIVTLVSCQNMVPLEFYTLASVMLSIILKSGRHLSWVIFFLQSPERELL